MCRRAIVRNNKRGSTLAAALALAFLVFAITTASLTRVASSAAQVRLRHDNASAAFLAEAGIQMAACRIMTNSSYTGEKGMELPTGSFDVTVKRSGTDYAVTATGHAFSLTKHGSKKTILAKVRVIPGKSFRITDWRQDP